MEPASTRQPGAAAGLTSAQASALLARDGPNELPSQRPRNLLHISKDVLTEPMFLLLISAATIYLFIGNYRESLILGASIVVVIAITILQERRTEQALARLKDLSSPRALVIRDGIEQRVPGRDVVVGDVIVLREGDRVPADGTLLQATALAIDESILTGESLPAEKTTDGAPERIAVYSGGLIVQGFGLATLTAIGTNTEIGKIGRALQALPAEPTPLFQEVRRVVRWVATLGLSACAFIALIYGSTRGDWIGGVLAGITVAMSVLPEEFPLVLTVFLAMGAWRISRTGVLTRRIPALESIGAATVLAVDKTGTLTENQMQVAGVECANSFLDLTSPPVQLTEDAQLLIVTAALASEIQPFDPMEKAIHRAARTLAAASWARSERGTLIKEYDLTPALLAVTHVWRMPETTSPTVVAKGAPETILDLCAVTEVDRAHTLRRVGDYAERGLRVLGVARGRCDAAPLPESPRAFQLEFLGLLCLADPLRSDVPAALRECTGAGIRVVMITGDHPGTALAIAHQAGFDTRSGVLTGAEMETLDDQALRERTRTINVYARTRPQHKLRLVQAFKADDQLIVMTGDGVNDAPALKAAHVGVAMGERGTDVAREAASLVLVNDDFNSLVGAVRLGRRIFDNIRHAMSYIVSVHIPIAGLGLLPVLLGWPLVLFPVHVLFLEFIIDPACALVFEADEGDANLMKRMPRGRSAPLFSAHLLERSIGLGLCVLLCCSLVYGLALERFTEAAARTLAFTAIVIGNLTLIFVSRSRSGSARRILARHNPLFWAVVATAVLALTLAIWLPGVAAIFRFAPPHWPALGLTIGATLASVLLVSRLLAARGPAAE